MHNSIASMASELLWRIRANRLSPNAIGNTTESLVGELEKLTEDFRIDVIEMSFFLYGFLHLAVCHHVFQRLGQFAEHRDVDIVAPLLSSNEKGEGIAAEQSVL